MDIELIKQRINEKLPDIEIYSINAKREFGNKVLEVVIAGEIDSSVISKKTKKLLDVIDDLIPNDVLLEVSSSGRNHDIELNELDNYIDKYVSVKTEEKIIYGYLRNNDVDSISVELNVKGRKKIEKVLKQDIMLIVDEVKL